jgi:predicted nucleic acid-binding Zn ribbon protein
MRKINCKQCGSEFHYCSSCNPRLPSSSEGFCSDECWRESAAYNERRTLALNMYNMLSYECKIPFWELINKVITNCNYCEEFIKWMDKEEDRDFKKEGKR